VDKVDRQRLPRLAEQWLEEAGAGGAADRDSRAAECARRRPRSRRALTALGGYRFALTLLDGEPAAPAVFATIIPRWQVGDTFLAGAELCKFRIVAIEPVIVPGEARDTFNAVWVVEPI
jgi:hypothetical protein